MEQELKNVFSELPEGFLAEALALTSPRDASRLSAVNSVFRSAAEWDSVWASFVPPECLAEAEATDGGGDSKEVYLRLCDHPVIIDAGNKSFWLDKRTGRKCYMLAAKQLSIGLIDSPNCWRWTSIAQSRFTEAAELISVCSLEVIGTVNTSILSPNTTYVACLVFMTTPKAYGFEYQPVELYIGSHEDNYRTRMAYLDPQAGKRRILKPRRRNRIFSKGAFGSNDEILSPSEENGPKRRKDGWFEVEIGEYFNNVGGESELEMCALEVKGGNWKTGIIIQGIEIRPKDCM